MHTVVAEWGDTSQRQPVRQPGDAVELCDRVGGEASKPELIGFTASNGAYFGIGVGADDSVAMFWATVDPPYFQSQGGPAESVDYSYCGHHTEVAGEARIPLETAYRALREFMSTGQRPECIPWTET